MVDIFLFDRKLYKIHNYMNIIIPIGGKGERFKNEGYTQPKPLITIFNKPMIFYVLDNLKITKDDIIFIIYYNLDISSIKLKYPNINFIEIDRQSDGAAETILLGLDKIKKMKKNKKTMIFDCDTFYTEDVIDMYFNTSCNAIFYVKDYNSKPIFSYINIDKNNYITQIKEKEKISDNANTGIYCFEDIDQLYLYAELVIINNIRFKSEFYISCIIDLMIQNHYKFIGLELEKNTVFNLGTPKQLKTYIDNTNIFLFDLDGTLVITDDIYYEVWTKILDEFNITLTPELYKNYICGNSDSSVLAKLIPSQVNKSLLQKDKLFQENIDKIKIIDGTYNFLEKIKKLGHKIALVTNCNRSTAELIIKTLKIEKYFETIIIGNECSNPKPYPDPYLKGIKFFNSSADKTIIFEDSKSGLLSGNGVNSKLLVGLETMLSHDELLNNFANITIKDYNEIKINEILDYKNDKVNILKTQIKELLLVDDVIIENNKLKGGFISDVIEVQLVSGDTIKNCVIKLENKNDNFLTFMANKLSLYEREYYFYECISKYVPINIAKFYGIIKDQNYNNIGIIMENLITKDYKLNLNLNIEPLKTSLNIIDEIAKLHIKFWNKPIQNYFKKLKNNNNKFWISFVNENWNKFELRWKHLLTEKQIEIGKSILNNYEFIQKKLCFNNLTLTHGDVKSANMFFDSNNKPTFIDWQYVCQGKGVQDLVFFMIESFDIDVINNYKKLFKEYYYVKIISSGINYSRKDYNDDFELSSYYFPFFVAIWFGTIDKDELIDKNFPFFFIQKLFNFYTN